MSIDTAVAMPGRPRSLSRLSQFIDYAFWLLYSFLLVRLILVFFSAATWVGFVRFVDTVTNPFYAPFRGIVASQNIGDGYILAVPILVAMVVYGLLHLAVHKLLWVMAYRKTAV